jgi:3-oxoacyl-[acyl-carrier protein] reductase
MSFERTLKSVLVTGASKGIGLAAARQLHQQGWHVIGVSRNSPSDFEGEFIECDLSNKEALQALCDQLSEHKNILGIVNNFGIMIDERFEQVTREDYEKLALSNNWPAIQLTQAVLPSMKAAKYGRIINVSSLVTKGAIYRTSYAASKASLESITRSMAIEFAKFGITANTVSPGPTETTLFRSNSPAGSESETRYLSKIPMNRLGRPDEVASAIVYLTSDLAGFITGQVINVDGGASI